MTQMPADLRCFLCGYSLRRCQADEERRHQDAALQSETRLAGHLRKGSV